jgi:hypothetical protein
MSLSCLRENPFRSPAWRWERASAVIEHRMFGPSRKRDGVLGHKWIMRTIRFKEAHDACRHDGDQYLVSARFPDIYWAYCLWSEPENPMRSTVEAYLLTGLSAFQIGHAVGLPPKSVEAYENVFFDVREKLVHRYYVLHYVIGPKLQSGLTEGEYDALWKLYAYFYGPHMLDAIVAKCANPLKCTAADRVGVGLQEDAINTMKLKAAVAAKTIKVNTNTQVELLNAFTKFVEVERTTGGASGNDQLLAHISDFFQLMPFCVAGRDPKQGGIKVDVHIQNYTHSAVELNYDENVFLSTGIVPDSLQGLEQVSYPEPVVARLPSAGTRENGETGNAPG